MGRRALLSALSCSILFGAASARAQAQTLPTVDEIINCYINRVGGVERLRAVLSVRRHGKYYSGGGFEADLNYENRRPNNVREDFTFGGLTGVTAFDGKNGWKIEPWAGKKDAEPLGEDELKGIIEDGEFLDPLFDYKARGNTATLIGTDQVEGTDVYKLSLTLASNGDVRTYYLDAESCVPIKYEVKRTVRGAERWFETELGDYKEVQGVLFPFSMATGAKGSSSADKQQFMWDRITVNPVLDDRRFIRPAPGEKVAVLDASAPVRSAGPSPATIPAAPRSAPLMRFAAASATVDSETTSGLGARNIGSAAMSGRVTSIAAVHEGNRLTVYVGSASGGVWKSTNGGTTFAPKFDKENVQSIGAIAIDPKDPKVVWVGSGESWMRNSVSLGDGIYKSVDGGETWTNMGLKNSEHIAKILIDPTNTNTVYACVPGKAFSDSDDRGVYKTTDGGKTWSKVLAGTNGSTGCSMMAMDPASPQTMFAGMWDFRRKGWTFRSGGDGPDAPSGSALFKSTNGGATWTALDEKSAKGLPAKPWGRVAVSVAPSNPNVVYAFIEAVPPLNGLYRSDDGGATWELRDRSQNMVWRPFYFANLIVDPKDENHVYKAGGSLIMSTDGGASFSNIAGTAHGDFHDVWVDPQNTDHIIVGDDGGLWYSYDTGDKWWKAETLPISQFYHVSVDSDKPYKVYGGLQDNSSWVGESQFPGGIAKAQWENLYGGDGFWMFADPSDPTYVYAESQGGYIGRINRKTHEVRDIQPLPSYNEGKLRFNWNTPIHLSPTNSGTLYIGAQFLFRSRDHGQTWQRISPDLTTNDPSKQQQEQSGGVTVDNSSAETHTTIFAIGESPKDSMVVWAGTDDGNLQVTRNGGKTWSNVVGNISGLPKNAWVSSVEPGHFAAGTIYATFDLHTFGDNKPYAYRSTDFGKTWTPLVAADSPVRGYAHVIKEDLVNPQLLFLGTEFGLWISVDGGQRWSRYKGGGLPAVAVRDLAIHPRDDDLVIATHGRGIWIVDNITPLRQMTAKTVARGGSFVETKPLVQLISTFGGWATGDAEFIGANPTGDAVITYYLQKRHIFGDMKLEVFDSTGKLVQTLPTGKRRGLSRTAWSMRMAPPRVPAAAAVAYVVGPRFLPGKYTVKLTDGDSVYSTALRVVGDGRAPHAAAGRKAQFALSVTLYDLLNQMTSVVDKMNDVRGSLDDRGTGLAHVDTLLHALQRGSAQVDTMRKKIVATKEGGMITGEERLRENLATLYGSVVGYEGAPTEMQVARTSAIGRELGDVSKEFDRWIQIELPKINKMLEGRGLPKIDPANIKP
jgi:photosystem II stability/assembly factor-like uncharacterized protein